MKNAEKTGKSRRGKVLGEIIFKKEEIEGGTAA